MATSELGKQILDNHITCPICLEVMKIPKILPCYHRVCLSCLKQLVQNNTLKCPVDRSIHCTISGNVEEDFKTDFVLRSIVEDIFSFQTTQPPQIPICVLKQKTKIHPLNDIRTMALTPEGQMWVADTKTNCICMMKDHLSLPWRLVKTDNIIFTKLCSFKDAIYAIKYGFCIDQLIVYNYKGQFYHNIDYPFDSVQMLAINKQEALFIVSPEQPKAVYSKQNQRDFFEKWIECEGDIKDICCTEDNVITVQNIGNSSYICKYNQNKELNWKYMVSGSLSKCKITPDFRNNILVLNTDKCEVFMLDSNGSLLGNLLTADDQIRQPHAILASPQNKLYIGEEEGRIKTFDLVYP